MRRITVRRILFSVPLKLLSRTPGVPNVCLRFGITLRTRGSYRKHCHAAGFRTSEVPHLRTSGRSAPMGTVRGNSLISFCTNTESFRLPERDSESAEKDICAFPGWARERPHLPQRSGLNDLPRTEVDTFCDLGVCREALKSINYSAQCRTAALRRWKEGKGFENVRFYGARHGRAGEGLQHRGIDLVGRLQYAVPSVYSARL